MPADGAPRPIPGDRSPGNRSELLAHRYETGLRITTHLANASPHGRSLEWR